MHNMLSNQLNDIIEDEASVADSKSESLAEALHEYQNQENVRNFRILLRCVLSGGHSIDLKMNNGQTLLHHAVSLDLVKEVIKILNCGAILMVNKYDKTPLDIAIERGNQIILQILNRSADYQNYLRDKFSNSNLPKVRLASNRENDSLSETVFGQHKYGWSEYTLDKTTNRLVQRSSYMRSVVHDDYLDWTGSHRAKHQQVSQIDKLNLSYSYDLSDHHFQCA